MSKKLPPTKFIRCSHIAAWEAEDTNDGFRFWINDETVLVLCDRCVERLRGVILADLYREGVALWAKRGWDRGWGKRG